MDVSRHHSCVAMSSKMLLWTLTSFIFVVSEVDSIARPPIREAPKVLEGSERDIGRTIPDISAVDLDGKTHELMPGSGQKALVIFMTNTSCPLCRRYGPSLAALEKDYAEKGVQFVFINSNRAEKLTRIRQAVEKQGFQGPYIHDVDHDVIRELQAKTTTEVFVIDRDRTLIYRGAVDDQYGFGYVLNAPRKTYLRDALDAVLNEQTPAVTATTAPGCELWISEEDE